MRVTDLLDPKGIRLGVGLKDKEDAIAQLVALHDSVGNLSDPAAFTEAIKAREAKGSTAVGQGIAIPHGKSSAVKKVGLVAITAPSGVDYEALDGQPSNLLFMIAAPDTAADTHLEVLSRLMTMLMDPEFDKALVEAKTTDEFLKAIDKKEAEKFPEAVTETPKPATNSSYQVLAVTACPTGIAHTYMAAEALELKAKDMGVSIKVETDGSGGAKNVLTDAEIAAADCIIIAADRNVEMARFDGKKVIKVPVSDGIHKPEELINKAISGEASVYTHKGGASSSSSSKSGSSVYRHLMNGVSHMLPFVVGGGILIAIAFLLDDYSIDPSNFGTNTPVAAWFKNVGGFAFSFMLPILAGYIAMSIADRPGLVVGFVGGYMASVGATFAAPGGDSKAVAGFLGALLAGFVGGYIVLCLEKICDYLPKAVDGIKPVLIYPLIGTLLIAVVMCAFNPLVAIINNGISDGLSSLSGASSIILGMIVAGMMAIDMGGPFNKASYAFGLAAISNGNYDVMAAVMIGGMVPPIAIALATTIFKNKFTDTERKNGPVNYIMGLCFITEGAIPYAAADPLRVIPSCIVGSAVAGALSMAFKCTLMAPHGGIFVFPVVGNWPMYLVALLIGAVVGCALLGILKKNVAK
ncbi:PTS fructose transporter subunit IIABC [Lachnospira pectinoschiza]|uniref:PTS system D-fructose-specific IIA component (F1P-forming), Frc family /PTS system D-fructose-specific IIB component (F1P-forming), Frc family /PTS system D-fructose-specific IIC component (F1P-for... n=1 Tax=Lachnospira pectinoschiza TaxID=28052 RepID=A0A1G9ZVA3_9FIRM|nr:fructose-specific PTS transporter subunit EIIC [Lachnospira pectinoschiza]SDN25200.1 PTS system D-fructose-specific IIA component (F1P-forming), Frc family /PTS system D-fructose-specific IIB component (F1P-forming), Frc family /PTS system D-fructose-specific IIC component (F1P-forming), Frc family [Lachnospira pectinoschiza]